MVSLSIEIVIWVERQIVLHRLRKEPDRIGRNVVRWAGESPGRSDRMLAVGDAG